MISTKEEEWQRYAQFARHFRFDVPYREKDDLFQDIILEMAERANGNGGLEEEDMRRAAKTVVMRHYRARRRDGRVASLNVKIRDTDIELWEILPAKAEDQEARVDAMNELLRYSPRLVAIAEKRVNGLLLTNAERHCLKRFWRRQGITIEGPLVPCCGQRIREVRVKLGWSQLKLARRSGLCQPAISHYETGVDKQAGVHNLEKIAKALMVCLEYLTSTD